MMNGAYGSNSEQLVAFSNSGVSYDVLLQEIQDLRQKVNASNQVSSLRDSERQFWQQLVDSNIRAGTIACVWCIKAQLFKKLSASFNKWKLFAALKAMAEQRAGTMVVSDLKSADAVGDAIDLLNRYKETESNLVSRIVNGGNIQNIRFPWQDRRVEQSEDILRESLDRPSAPSSTGIYHQKEPSITVKNHSYTPDEAMQEYEHQYSGFVRLSNTLLDKDTDPETKRKLLLTMSKDILSRSSNYGSSSADNHQQLSQQATAIGGRESWNTFTNRRNNNNGEENSLNARDSDRQSYFIDELATERDQAANSHSYSFIHSSHSIMNDNLIPAAVDVSQRSSLHLLKGSHSSSNNNSQASSPHYMQPRHIDNHRFKPPVTYKSPAINESNYNNSILNSSQQSAVFDYQPQPSPFQGTNPQSQQYRRGSSRSPGGRRRMQQQQQQLEMQQEEPPSYLQFRHGATGDYIRRLISPKSKNNSFPPGRRFFDESTDQVRYSDSYHRQQQRQSAGSEEEHYSRPQPQHQAADINIRRGSHSDAGSFISNPGRYYDYQPSRGQQSQQPYEYDRSVSDINQRSLRSRSGSPNDLPRYRAVTSSYKKKTRGGTSPYKQSTREPREQAARRSTSRNERGSSVPPASQSQQPLSSRQPREASVEHARVNSGNSVASSGIDSKVAHNPITSRARGRLGGQGRVSTVPIPPGYIDMSVRDYHDGRDLQRDRSSNAFDHDNQSRASSVLTKESLADHGGHMRNGNAVISEQQSHLLQMSPELDPSGSSMRHKLPPRGSNNNQSTSSSMTKMESAQRRLLFGDLDDIVDTKRGWQRNLRR